MSEHHSVAIIGGGQAGLSVSYCLKQRGIEHVLLEKHWIGHSWRARRWDAFCLVTPNWQCQLPGFPYAGPDPQGFMGKNAIVSYLESYAASFSPPIRGGVDVRSITRLADTRSDLETGFELQTSMGRITADQVVVATGSYHVASIPALGAEIPTHVAQVHSADYRNPSALPPGEVLVVGSGQSGCQIAEDLHLAGRKVHLCIGNAPRCARRYRGKDVVEWLDQMGYYEIPIDKHPNREQVRDKTNHYVTGRDGGHDLDLRQFALEGMQLYGSLRSIRAGHLEFATDLKQNLDGADAVYASINRSIDAYIEKQGIAAPQDTAYSPVWSPEIEPTTLDLGATAITSVVWCIGFGADFSWIHLPVFDERGYPRHERGVTESMGLYFIGLPWLHTWGSGRFSGVGRDAEHLSERIDALDTTIQASRTAPKKGGTARAVAELRER